MIKEGDKVKIKKSYTDFYTDDWVIDKEKKTKKTDYNGRCGTIVHVARDANGKNCDLYTVEFEDGKLFCYESEDFVGGRRK